MKAEPSAGGLRGASEKDGRCTRVTLAEKRILIPSALLAGCTVSLFASDVVAQDASGETLQQVVVSARHREESQLDVPLAITAIDSDSLQRQNIQRFADYITRIPNLSASYGASLYGLDVTRATVIRGVAGSNTTAYYIDDTPVPSTISPQVVDLERIEVLKGPQGTLYGASSMGGNLRFITKQPSLAMNDYRLRAQGGYTDGGGSADYGVEGAGNFVLVPDKVGLRAVLQYTRDSGFTKRTYLAPDGSRVVVGDQGQTSVSALSVTLKTQFTDRLSASVMAMGQLQDTQGFPVAYAPLPDFRIDSYTTDHINDIPQFTKDHWGLSGISLKYAAEKWNVASSTSYFIGDSILQEDGTEATTQFVERITGVDLGNTPAVWSDFYRSKRLTHETRYSFDTGLVADWLSGIAGVYAQRSTLEAVSAGVGKKPLMVEGLAASGLFPSDLYWDTHFGDTTWNKAVFGELYLEPFARTQITLGLRQYWIDQDSDPTLSDGFGAFGSSTPARSYKQSGHVPKFVVAYKFTPDTNGYASYSEGFRIGGSQPPVPDFCTASLAQLGLTPDDTRRYDSDTLKSYELGFKANTLGGRAATELAAFQIDWSNIQQSAALDCGFAFTANAGRARIRGGEFAFDGRPFAGTPLTMQLGVGYLDPVMVEPGALPQAPGSKVYLVPSWTASLSAYYVHPLSQSTDLFIGGDYSYTDSVKTANVVADVPQTRQPIEMVNARIGLTFGNSEFSLYGQNLLNERYNFGDVRSLAYELRDNQGARLPRVVAARPLQLGVQYRWHF